MLKMNADKFWHIIEIVHADSGGNMDRKCQLLKAHLSTLKSDDLRGFLVQFDSADAAAYTWGLWGAAYVMHGGCSDDSFSDFRATLISYGRDTYERALEDPESLVNLDFEDKEDICFEGFQYVKNEVAEEKLGEIPECVVSLPGEPTGSEWDEDSLDQLFPKLTAKYSSCRGDDPLPAIKPWWKFW